MADPLVPTKPEKAKSRGFKKDKSSKKGLPIRSDSAANALPSIASTLPNDGKPQKKRKARIRHTKNFDSSLRDPILLKQRVKGKIKMKLIGATNLANTDTVGVSDPYCVIRANFDPQLRAKTKVIKNSLNPRWNEEFVFDVNVKNAEGEFHINLFDYDFVGKDDWLGMIIIPLYGIVEAPRAVGINTRLPLNLETKQKGKGDKPAEIVVDIRYEPSEAPPEAIKFSLISSPGSGKKEKAAKDKKDKKDKTDKKEKKDKKAVAVPEEPDAPPEPVIGGAIVDKIENEDDIKKLYEFKKTLGEGATAVVKLATITASSKDVAVKVVDKNSSEWDEFAIESFKTEMNIMKLVKSEFLLPAQAIHETAPFFYIVMDLVPGGDLFEAIENSEEGQLEQHLARKWIHDIMSGLSILHSLYICHRDIKPENVLISSKDYPNATAKLVDYGAGDFYTKSKPYMTAYTGTLSYMAPEIVEGKKYTKAVDVWSLGVLAYVMLSGGQPFDGEDDAEITQAILDADVQFDEYWTDVSPLAQMLVASCLSYDVKSRTTLANAMNNPWFKE